MQTAKERDQVKVTGETKVYTKIQEDGMETKGKIMKEKEEQREREKFANGWTIEEQGDFYEGFCARVLRYLQ